jgi:hypothetical protein
MPLFPLPLVPFEHYMLTDDRADYPMTFFLQLRFAGSMDQPRFRAALDSAVALHPLLRAHVRVAFGAASHAGRLTLSLQYDRLVLTPGEGHDLLDQFVRQLRESVSRGALAA